MALKTAIDRGVIIITCTQCLHGSVNALYETGKVLTDLGVILGNDITPEAALTKLSYVLSMDELDIDKKRRLMTENLVGEMTMMAVSSTDNKTDELDIFETVIESLHIHTSKEIKRVHEIMYPSILCSTVYHGEPDQVEKLRKYGLLDEINAEDYDNRTPLHIACSKENNIEMVEYLLKNGASVHCRDRNGDTPLSNAVKFGNKNTIRILRECGAHLHGSKIEIGEQLCNAARCGNKDLLSHYHCAGANLNTSNVSKSTPLHCAVEAGHLNVVDYLLRQGVDYNKVDLYERTALEIAQILKRNSILKLFRGLN